jgi:hypothetical protein
MKRHIAEIMGAVEEFLNNSETLDFMPDGTEDTLDLSAALTSDGFVLTAKDGSGATDTLTFKLVKAVHEDSEEENSEDEESEEEGEEA